MVDCVATNKTLNELLIAPQILTYYIGAALTLTDFLPINEGMFIQNIMDSGHCLSFGLPGRLFALDDRATIGALAKKTDGNHTKEGWTILEQHVDPRRSQGKLPMCKILFFPKTVRLFLRIVFFFLLSFWPTKGHIGIFHRWYQGSRSQIPCTHSPCCPIANFVSCQSQQPV